MTHASHHWRKTSHHAPILKTGVAAMAVGLGLLAASSLVDKSSPLEAAISTALSMPAWWSMGMGAVLVAAHGLLTGQRRAARRRWHDAPHGRGPTRLETSTLLDLIDQAESSFGFAVEENAGPDTEAHAPPAMRPITRPS
ncbi:MAG: hypothetical protein R3E56_20730 [Burkholderiaceae bacterium]